jgi:hypothetical protein
VTWKGGTVTALRCLAFTALVVGWAAMAATKLELALVFAPCLLLVLPLIVGRYVGEDGLHRLARWYATRRRLPRTPRARARWTRLPDPLLPSSPRPGGFLTRGPPAVVAT